MTTAGRHAAFSEGVEGPTPLTPPSAAKHRATVESPQASGVPAGSYTPSRNYRQTLARVTNNQFVQGGLWQTGANVFQHRHGPTDPAKADADATSMLSGSQFA